MDRYKYCGKCACISKVGCPGMNPDKTCPEVLIGLGEIRGWVIKNDDGSVKGWLLTDGSLITEPEDKGISHGYIMGEISIPGLRPVYLFDWDPDLLND